jgi:hypothetical protein
MVYPPPFIDEKFGLRMCEKKFNPHMVWSIKRMVDNLSIFKGNEEYTNAESSENDEQKS